MKFWDTSAILPLLVMEENTALRLRQHETDPAMVVWFGTLAEVEGALARRKREHRLPASQEAAIRARLAELAASWTEVAPTSEVRRRAIRLLRVHPLRTADALQLAAALVFCEERPHRLPFLTADLRLREAADAEGFPFE